LLLFHVGSAADAQLPALGLGPLSFSAGTEHRVFVAVPEGATWGEMVLKAGAHDTPKVGWCSLGGIYSAQGRSALLYVCQWEYASHRHVYFVSQFALSICSTVLTCSHPHTVCLRPLAGFPDQGFAARSSIKLQRV
jgi:hypothetical protein